MSAPFEVVMAVATVYVAPVGTAFPATNAAPGGSWFELGTAGSKNYDEPGVVITHNQTLNPWRPAGGTAARKVNRSAEDLTIEFTLVDLTPAQYAKILNNATVTTLVGPPATQGFPLMQGTSVATYAILARTVSSVNDSLNMQFQLNSGYMSSSPKPSFEKDKPAGLDVQFTGLDDGSATPWQLIAQTA